MYAIITFLLGRKFMEGEQEILVHHLKRHDPILISTSMLCGYHKKKIIKFVKKKNKYIYTIQREMV